MDFKNGVNVVLATQSFKDSINASSTLLKCSFKAFDSLDVAYYSANVVFIYDDDVQEFLNTDLHCKIKSDEEYRVS